MCEIPQPVPSMKSPKLKRGERQTPSVQEWTGLRARVQERESSNTIMGGWRALASSHYWPGFLRGASRAVSSWMPGCTRLMYVLRSVRL